MIHRACCLIGEWDVTQVTSMIFMLSQVSGFNGNLSKWHVDKFMCVRNMFSGSKSYNQDLSKTNVAPVVDMSDMFSSVISFKKVLCDEIWVSSKVNKIDHVCLRTHPDT